MPDLMEALKGATKGRACVGLSLHVESIIYDVCKGCECQSMCINLDFLLLSFCQNELCCLRVRIRKEIWVAMPDKAWFMHERCMTADGHGNFEGLTQCLFYDISLNQLSCLDCVLDLER